MGLRAALLHLWVPESYLYSWLREVFGSLLAINSVAKIYVKNALLHMSYIGMDDG